MHTRSLWLTSKPKPGKPSPRTEDEKQGEIMTEQVEPSVNEETLDTDVEESLENDDASFEEPDEETQETEEESEDESANESEEESEEESEADDTQEPLEENTTSEAERKKHNAEMAQKRIAEKQQREELKRLQQEEYLNAAEDPRDIALRQLQIDAYNNRIDSNNNKLENGLERALASIDILQKGTEAEVKAMYRALDNFERMYVVRDRNGDPVEVNGDVYKFLQEEADSIRGLTSVGARAQTKAKDNTKSRTDAVPTRAPKEAKKDDLLDGFDEEASRW